MLRPLRSGPPVSIWDLADLVRSGRMQTIICAMNSWKGTHSASIPVAGLAFGGVDETPVEGRPGAMCIFPHGQTSEWLISKPLEMIHLYLPDTELRRMFSELTDRDGRLFSLADVTYQSAGHLYQPFRALFDALSKNDLLAADLAMLDMVGRIVSEDSLSAMRMQRLKGGLSSVIRKRLTDYIDANLDQPIKLKDLADVAGLSEFHLQRSFKETCGVTPQAFITRRRLDLAQRLIREDEPLTQVAVMCGFSSQAHLSRVFKSGVGLTPSAYRLAIAG